jgi:hypothetical protein
MRRTAWSTVPLVLLALAGEAGAQQTATDSASQASAKPRVYFPPPRVTVFASLTYERRPGAEVCPDESIFRLEAGRIGRDPFEPDPEGISVGAVRVVITREPGGFAARYEWTGSRDVYSPTGRFEEPGHTRRDCWTVLADVAVSLGSYFVLLEVHYGKLFAPKRSTPACPSAETATPAPCVESRFSVWPTEWPLPPLEKPKLHPPERPERWPIAVRMGAAVWPEVFASGVGSLGLSADVGVRYRAFSASIEAHGDPPLASQAFANRSVSYARISGVLLLCGHFGWFAGCGVGDAGRILFPSRIPGMPPSTLYGAAGVRAGFEFPVAPPRLFLRTVVDLLAPIRPASYGPAGITTFRVASPSAGLGLGVLVELPR